MITDMAEAGAGYIQVISGRGVAQPGSDLFALLESLLPVKFGDGVEQHENVGGELLSLEQAHSARHGVSSLSVATSQTKSADSAAYGIKARFEDVMEVPFPFRGRSVESKVHAEYQPLTLLSGEKVMATGEAGPWWTVREQDGVRHYRSALELPFVPGGGVLHEAFNEFQFLAMVPLIHWLREIGNEIVFRPPPLRACYIFDDPNLHWPTYGRVKYREIAAHAERENYHVSFATVPLDVWYTHSGTAEIFRQNSRRLSLTVHGNNHTRYELAQKYTNDERLALLSQANQRIKKLERRTGLSVSRVMIPPHGACSDQMLAVLPLQGFDGACISSGSLRFHNRGQAWTRTVGFSPSEVIHGCPVMPRWGLKGPTENILLLAAFLGQPLILRGHHQDLKEGLEVLDKAARFINGLGRVFWSNLSDIMRVNYEWRVQGEVCHVRPRSREVTVSVPDRVNRVIVDSPSDIMDGNWKLDAVQGNGTTRSGQFAEWAGFNSNIQRISLNSTFGNPMGENRGTSPPPVALVRRILMEGRDRLVGLGRF